MTTIISTRKGHRLENPTRRLQRLLIYIIVIFLACVILVPFFWMVSTALQEKGDIFAWPPQWIPDPPQWHNFARCVDGDAF